MSTWNMPPGVSTLDIPGNEDPELDPENYDADCNWIGDDGERLAYDPAADWTDSHPWNG